MKKSILFVCLGNICRSPAAEAVFLHQIKLRGIQEYFHVDSAGTGSWHIGKKADSRMLQAASQRGIDITSRARQINLNDFKKFDLILTMDNSNLDDVQKIARQLTHSKLIEIHPLLSYSKKSKLIEVPDPYYGGDKGFDQVLDLLEDSINGLLSTFNLSE